MRRSILALWSALLALAFANPAFAQGGQGTDPLAQAMAVPTASGLVGAPGGPGQPFFAWVENQAGVRNIWFAVAGQPPRQLTRFAGDDGLQIYGLAFAGRGDTLAFVRGGDGEFPDAAGLPNTGIAPSTPEQQIFVVAASGGAEPRLVGRGHSPVFSQDGQHLAFVRRGELWVQAGNSDTPERVASVVGQIRALSWSPDDRRLLFSEERGEHSFVGVYSVADRRLAYLDPGLGNAAEPVFSPDGASVAFIRFLVPPTNAAADSGPYWSVRVVDLASGRARTLWSAPQGQGGRYAGTRSRNLFWSRDGLLIFPWERSGWMHVYALDAVRGGEPRALTSGAYEVETFLLGPDRTSLVYAANDGEIDRRRIWRVPLRGGAPVRLGDESRMLFAPVVAGEMVGAIATDTDSTAHPVLLSPRQAPLGTARDIPGMTAPEAVAFRATDGLEIRGQLFRARGGAGRHPALIFVHGGPRRQMLLGFHPSGYYSNAYILNQHLAAQGYNVLAVNYRGGTGYGQAFREAAETGRDGASEYRDILAAGRWLAARDDVDPARIGIWGGSWGGYLTALALARDSSLFASGVDLHGVHSMIRPVPASLPPQAQDRARMLQWESSPLGAIERWRSPVLLIHGDDDRNVDFGQSLILARELAGRRIPYRELVFPNERHSFFRHDHWLESFRATVDFLDLTLMRRQPLP